MRLPPVKSTNRVIVYSRIWVSPKPIAAAMMSFSLLGRREHDHLSCFKCFREGAFSMADFRKPRVQARVEATARWFHHTPTYHRGKCRAYAHPPAMRIIVSRRTTVNVIHVSDRESCGTCLYTSLRPWTPSKLSILGIDYVLGGLV